MVLGLPLITATRMIIDTVDNVVEAKHLDCPPFRINFCRATTTIPAIEEDATTHYVELKDVQNILAKTNAYIAGVCEHYQLVKPPKIRISEPHRQVGAVSDSKSVSTTQSFATRWIPPPLANYTGDYHMFWETLDTCEFPIRPDQALLGNQQWQSIVHSYICLATYPCYVCDILNSY
jgi:hypothetical protein